MEESPTRYGCSLSVREEIVKGRKPLGRET